MIELKDYKTGNKILLEPESVVAIRETATNKRTFVYVGTSWYFDCEVEYKVLQNYLKKARGNNGD